VQYLKKSFTVAPGNEKAYRDNFDAIFGKKPAKKPRIRVRKELRATKKAGG